MTPEARQFWRELVRMALYAAIQRTMWGLPLPVLLLLIAVLIGAVYYFDLF